jgi:phosphoribosyl-AMP cyclohydrolase / phosphoribosyl-ATP pyrophosphohydrolase
MNNNALNLLDWQKAESGLLPAVVQDYQTGRVLMLGYMNQHALAKTIDSQQVTFFSRSKQRLWTKGESSGHVLQLVDIHVDCDNDTLLVTANPIGPTCHNGTITCFGDEPVTAAEQVTFLSKLEAVIAQRIVDKPEGSYTAHIWERGITRMAQKVGEEGVEVALAAVTQVDAQLVSESADLLYHVALLLKARNLSLTDVVRELEQRHAAKP